jgi:hypothetical protein
VFLRSYGVVTLVTLPHVTDAATMQKISFWRYLAVNRKNLFAALACALLVFGMLGCGTSNNLQSVQLSTSNTAEVPMGTLDLKGVGGTLQLYSWGNYSSGKKLLLNNRDVTYKISITPGSAAWTGFMGDPNAAPAQTVQLTPNALLTAVSPFACTWINEAVPPATSPAWAILGTYSVTATYSGFTSPPAYIVVASEAGIASVSNPTGACGP